MTEKIERRGTVTSRIGLGWADKWWDTPVVKMNTGAYSILLQGAGGELHLRLDREQFDQLFDAMCEVTHARDMKEIDDGKTQADFKVESMHPEMYDNQ